MDKSGLSSKIVLILAAESNLSLFLKNELQKEIGVVDIVSNLHQAVIQTILTEPDIIFIEVSPENFSGLQLPEILQKVKGVKKNPRIMIFADRRTEEPFRQKVKNILFLDGFESSAVSTRIKRILEKGASLENDNLLSWIPYQERGEAWPANRKELDILEKLGQLGILKKT
jgi:hypothetical protein